MNTESTDYWLSYKLYILPACLPLSYSFYCINCFNVILAFDSSVENIIHEFPLVPQHMPTNNTNYTSLTHSFMYNTWKKGKILLLKNQIKRKNLNIYNHFIAKIFLKKKIKIQSSLLIVKKKHLSGCLEIQNLRTHFHNIFHCKTFCKKKHI